MAGCVSFGADCCSAASVPSCVLVADLAHRRRGIVLQRSFELGDLDRASASPRRSCSRRSLRSRCCGRNRRRASHRASAPRRTFGSFAHRRQRADQRRPHELAFFLVERGQQPRRAALGSGSARNRHRPPRAADRSARPSPSCMASAVRGSLKPVSSVSALKRMKPSACSLTACSSAGDRLRGGRAANRAARGHARGVVEIGELVDGGADLLRRGRRRASLLRGRRRKNE